MKKISLVAFLLVAILASVSAQHPINSLYDDLGAVNLSTEDLKTCRDAEGRYCGDTVVKVFHRLDDIVWSKMVYRIIDLRYKQNYSLNFPTLPSDPDYKNFIKLILDAAIDGMPVYPKADCAYAYSKNPTFTLKPDFSKPMSKADFIRSLLPCEEYVADAYGEKTYNLDSIPLEYNDVTPVFYDSVADAFSYSSDANFLKFKNGQYKFLIQEFVFFDKHTSRLERKIVAIAPLNTNKITMGVQMAQTMQEEDEAVEENNAGDDENAEDEEPDEDKEEVSPLVAARMAALADDYNYMGALYESIMFWIPFDYLRPYLAKQYVIPEKNEVKRVTYDDFFQKHLYTDYLVGDGNMYNRMITDFRAREGKNMSEEQIKQEQARIQTEMLNMEQDLWEY